MASNLDIKTISIIWYHIKKDFTLILDIVISISGEPNNDHQKYQNTDAFLSIFADTPGVKKHSAAKLTWLMCI
jgi:hypothetical protein